MGSSAKATVASEWNLLALHTQFHYIPVPLMQVLSKASARSEDDENAKNAKKVRLLSLFSAIYENIIK